MISSRTNDILFCLWTTVILINNGPLGKNFEPQAADFVTHRILWRYHASCPVNLAEIETFFLVAY